MTPLLPLYRECLLRNELGGRQDLAYRFSDCDGPGRSGYSFGICQFDLRHNRAAAICLRECGFSEEEIRGLVQQSHPRAYVEGELSRRLQCQWRRVDEWDSNQMERDLHHVMTKLTLAGVDYSDEVLLHLTDYHNQLCLSDRGPMMRHLISLRREVRPEDVREFKLRLAWGRKRPDDVERRFANIQEVCAGKGPL